MNNPHPVQQQIPQKPNNEHPETSALAAQHAKRKAKAAEKLHKDITLARRILHKLQTQYKDLTTDMHRLIYSASKKHKTVDAAMHPLHWIRLFIPYSYFCMLIASLSVTETRLRYIAQTKSLIAQLAINDKRSASTLLGTKTMKQVKWTGRGGSYNKDPNSGRLAGGYTQIECNDLFSINLKYDCKTQHISIEYYVAAYEWDFNDSDSDEQVIAFPVYGMHYDLIAEGKLAAERRKKKASKSGCVKNTYTWVKEKDVTADKPVISYVLNFMSEQ